MLEACSSALWEGWGKLSIDDYLTQSHLSLLVNKKLTCVSYYSYKKSHTQCIESKKVFFLDKPMPNFTMIHPLH